ncbi:Uncharacterised protein [Mycobacteroides abscessus subsp. abscessus]|nr:Uncharacterised protein [Mycobacteroides abscessus subsp. abscessus]SKE60282.1 Uncharacterised protein [Mycobacteroides abscessus subsp. abscessus]SLG55398.1 Uncharacterised protein [Mycobacteroides abscessus subsp. abscessus]
MSGKVIALLVAAVIGAFGLGAVFGHQRWTVTNTVSVDQFGSVCESVQRTFIADRGPNPTSNTGPAEIPGMPIEFTIPQGLNVGVVSNRWPSEVTAEQNLSPNEDQQRVGIVDIAPINNTIYSMGSLPKSASNMAVAQVLTQQFINSLGAVEAKCEPTYWVGPNLPGDLERVEVTDGQGQTTTAIVAVVGIKEARVLLFARGNAQYPEISKDLIVQLGRTMRLTQKPS